MDRSGTRAAGIPQCDAQPVSMWCLLRDMVGSECQGGTGLWALDGIPERAVATVAVRPMEYLYRTDAAAWTHVDMLRAEATTTNLRLVDRPARALVVDPVACCVCTGDPPTTRTVLYAALVKDTQPGFALGVARTCHPDCVNPGHVLETPPSRDAYRVQAPVRRRGKPVDRQRAELIARTYVLLNCDIRATSRHLGIRPARLRKRLGDIVDHGR